MCPYVIGRNQDTIGVSEAEICHFLFCYSSSFCEQYFSALCRFNGRRDILRCADLDDIEGSDSDSETEDILCKQCKRTFYSVANKEKHACKGLGSRHNIVNFSITYAYDKVQQHQLTVVQGDNDQSAIDILKALPIQGARCTFRMGWANVPPQGKMYGKKYIAPFADDIIVMYLAGKNDKSKRTGPPGMLKALARKYSDRLDLPAENEIRQAISKLMAQEKEGKSLSLKPKYKGLHPHHTRLIDQFFILSGGSVMPTAGSKEFLQKHPAPLPDELIVDAGSYPSEKDVKKRITDLRKLHRATGKFPDVADNNDSDGEW
jgi:hypothetical protein